MMTNEDNYLLITNLHSYAHYEEQNDCPKTAKNLRLAADRLEALTAENAKLREALLDAMLSLDDPMRSVNWPLFIKIMPEFRPSAREALGEG